MFQTSLQMSLMNNGVWKPLLEELRLLSQTIWIQILTLLLDLCVSLHLLCLVSQPLDLHCSSCYWHNYLDHTLPRLHSSFSFCSVITMWDLFNILLYVQTWNCKGVDHLWGNLWPIGGWEPLLNSSFFCPLRIILWLLFLHSSVSSRLIEAQLTTQWSCQ